MTAVHAAHGQDGAAGTARWCRAGGHLVLHPAQLGLAVQRGDVKPEFLVQLAGERRRDVFVGVHDAAWYRVLVAVRPAPVDQRYLAIVQEQAADPDGEGRRGRSRTHWPGSRVRGPRPWTARPPAGLPQPTERAAPCTPPLSATGRILFAIAQLISGSRPSTYDSMSPNPQAAKSARAA